MFCTCSYKHKHNGIIQNLFLKWIIVYIIYIQIYGMKFKNNNHLTYRKSIHEVFFLSCDIFDFLMFQFEFCGKEINNWYNFNWNSIQQKKDEGFFVVKSTKIFLWSCQNKKKKKNRKTSSSSMTEFNIDHQVHKICLRHLPSTFFSFILFFLH